MTIVSILRFLDKYKTYFLFGIIVILLIVVFTPSSIKTLTKREIKVIVKENKGLMKQYKKNLDSIKYYKTLYQEEANKSDSSKKITNKIKIKTNEEVNMVPTFPFDTNIVYFPRELEEFLQTIDR